VIRLSSTEPSDDAPEVEPDELREGLVARLGDLLGDDLIATDAGLDLSRGGEVRSSQQVARLATVNSADKGFLVEEAFEE
jgi:hypothetical protein